MELTTRTTHGRPIERPAKEGEKPRRYPKGRLCAGSKCPPGTLLSIYNKGPLCSVCEPARHVWVESVEDLEELMA